MKYIKPQIECVKVECNIVATSFPTDGKTEEDNVIAGPRINNLNKEHNLWDEVW